MTAPPLANILPTLILPSAEQTLLLRAALHPHDRAREALLAWQSSVPRPTASLARRPGGGKLLAPLLHAKHQSRSEGIDARLLTYLRTAIVREELRSREYRRILAEVLAAIDGAGLEAILLQGAALAETVYPEPHLRHSHDIDILVRQEDLPRSAELLSRIGYSAHVQPDGPAGPAGRFVHESGLPLALHANLFLFHHYNTPLAEVWDRSLRTEILGATARLLSPSDQLLHTCAHAATGWHRETLLWACDAWFVLAHRPALDWEALLDRAERARVHLPLQVTLGFMARELEAAVPAGILERLSFAPRHGDRLAAELALFGAWAGPGRRITHVIARAGSWRERAFVLRWRLIPSPAALVSTGRIRTRGRSPLFYAARPVRFVGRRVRRMMSPPPRPSSGCSAPGA
ncbi:MAG: nucleotidyltransferase family protein [Gemmatimonadetes bacterium]|nr:nucleotidyltransferase family protein [Gemmatimonadota bacterium]